MKGEEMADQETVKILKIMIEILKIQDEIDLYKRGFCIFDK